MYTFDAESAEYDEISKLWVYPEGPPKNSQEKKDFTREMNENHELWSSNEYGPRKNSLRKEVDSFPPGIRKISFNVELTFLIAGMFGYSYRHDKNGDLYLDKGGQLTPESEFIDEKDRSDRISFNFGEMLVAFVEKALSDEQKEGFFDYGGIGRRWSKNREMMKEFQKRFDWYGKRIEADYLSGKTTKIGLSEQTIPAYPLVHFKRIRVLFLAFMKNGPRLNPLSREFIFEGSNEKPQKNSVPSIARTSPKKICGVYRVNEDVVKPPKPLGPPSPQRPMSRISNTEKQIESLEQKIKELINLTSQPVCIATPL